MKISISYFLHFSKFEFIDTNIYYLILSPSQIHPHSILYYQSDIMGRTRLGAAAAARKRAADAAAAVAPTNAPAAPTNLKKGDLVRTVPSEKYPESVILTVDRIILSGNEFLIYFKERKSASEYAKYGNLGRTFFRIDNQDNVET